MTKPPNWNQLGATPLAADDEAEVRLDAAADNLLATLLRAIQALERNDMPGLADQLGTAFLHAFGDRRQSQRCKSQKQPSNATPTEDHAMNQETPEPLSDDPEELKQLQRIAALETPEEAARYLVSRGFNEYDAADFVFSLLRAVRREG